MSYKNHNFILRFLINSVGAAFILLATLSYAQTPLASVSLAWNPSSDPGTVGYKLYYGTSSGNYTGSVNVGGATTTTLPALKPGATYYFVVTAYNAFGIESLPSNETSYHDKVSSVPVIVRAPQISSQQRPAIRSPMNIRSLRR